MQRWIDVGEEVPYCCRIHQFSPKCSPNGGIGGIRDNILCPTITPQISSFGTVPCNTKLNAISTHGKYGAVKTSRPKKLSLVSGLRLLQMYTKLLLNADPRNGIESKGERTSKTVVA